MGIKDATKSLSVHDHEGPPKVRQVTIATNECKKWRLPEHVFDAYNQCSLILCLLHSEKYSQTEKYPPR